MSKLDASDTTSRPWYYDEFGTYKTLIHSLYRYSIKRLILYTKNLLIFF